MKTKERKATTNNNNDGFYPGHWKTESMCRLECVWENET